MVHLACLPQQVKVSYTLGPVMSTDKLEKPKHNNNQQQPTSQTSSNPPSAPCTGSLPRRNASGVFYRTPQDFVGGSQSNLRRNCSMNDLQQKNQDNEGSWLPAPPPQVENRMTTIILSLTSGRRGFPSSPRHGSKHCHHCSSRTGCLS